MCVQPPQGPSRGHITVLGIKIEVDFAALARANTVLNFLFESPHKTKGKLRVFYKF